MATESGNIHNPVQGDDLRVDRTYPLDGNYSITYARLKIVARLSGPPISDAIGADCPVFIAIDNSGSAAYGTITDTGVVSGKAVMYFLIPKSMTDTMYSTEMYFYEIATFDANGMRYSPESGSWTTKRNIIQSEAP